MAVSVAAVAAKAAVAAASSKQGRIAVATVVAAVLLPFMLAAVVVLSLLDGTSTHNVAAVKQAFFGGTLTGQIPQEYRGYMKDIQKSFTSIDQLISEIENLEDGPADDYRIKSLFYALYFGDEQPSIRKFQTHIAQMIFVREASQRHRIALLRLRSLSWKE